MSQQTQRFPYISIIIPTYNRPQSLAACLTSLVGSDYPGDRFEIIVIDDGGSCALESVIAPFQPKLTLTLLTQPNAGPATARNAGASVAKGRLLAFTDDDCCPAADWLTVLARYWVPSAAETPCAVGGHTHNALSHNGYAAASQALTDYLYQHFNRLPEQAEFFTSNNLMVTAAAFRAMGGFDQTFPLAAAEDREFCDRWRRQGYRLIYAPAAIVNHAHDLTLASFWRQQLNYGRGAFHFHQRVQRQAPGPVKPSPKSPGASFYLGLLAYPLRQGYGLRGVPMALLFLLSQVAVATGLLMAGYRHQVLQSTSSLSPNRA